MRERQKNLPRVKGRTFEEAAEEYLSLYPIDAADAEMIPEHIHVLRERLSVMVYPQVLSVLLLYILAEHPCGWKNFKFYSLKKALRWCSALKGNSLQYIDRQHLMMPIAQWGISCGNPEKKIVAEFLLRILEVNS